MATNNKGMLSLTSEGYIIAMFWFEAILRTQKQVGRSCWQRTGDCTEEQQFEGWENNNLKQSTCTMVYALLFTESVPCPGSSTSQEGPPHADCDHGFRTGLQTW